MTNTCVWLAVAKTVGFFFFFGGGGGGMGGWGWGWLL